MAGIIAEADKVEDWIEKEVGLIEHRVTTTKAFHSAEHIAGKIDGWIETLDSGLDAETRQDYIDAAKFIRGLFA